MKMANRIKNMGFKLFLDFQYSDTWADPAHQSTPASWAGQNTSQLAQTVHDYTANVITQLKNQGTLPSMVQIGNETDCGMMWPTGDTCSDDRNWSNFVSYINAGIRGVRDVTASTDNVRIQLHYATLGTFMPDWWFDAALQHASQISIP